MKLILFSDLHLDSQFAWLGGAGGAARRRALRETLLNIVGLAREEQADALLCGGDLYEHERVTPDTADFLRAAFASLAPVPVFLAPGNHDWYGPGTVYQRTAWSPNVHLFRSSRLEPVDPADGMRLWGAAHCAPAGTAGFLDGFHTDGNAVHLALFHGSEQGWLAEQGEHKALHAPFRERQIQESGLAHALLGHYHRPRQTPAVTYPGNPDPLAFGEDGERGAVVISVDGRGEVSRRTVPVGVTRLVDVEVDLSGCSHQQEALDRIRERLAGGSGFVRVTLCGEVDPGVDLRLPDLGGVFPHLEAVLIRSAVRPAYDIEALRHEPTVRGRFVQDVLAAPDLPEDQRHRVLAMGLRALDGRSDLDPG